MFRQVLKGNLFKGSFAALRQETALRANSPQLLSAGSRFFSGRSVPQFRYQRPDPSKEHLIKEKCFKHLQSDRQEKWPAICIAAEAGYPAVVKSLIEAGEEVNSIAHLGVHRMTPLQIAVVNKHIDVAKVLRDAGASLGKKPIDLLITAVRNADVGMVCFLYSAGVDVNQGTDRHFTALDQAVLLNDPNMIGCLLHLGANVHGSMQGWFENEEADEKYDSRQTPLRRAVEHNHTEAVICLLNDGAKTLDNGLSLLRRAVENNNEQITRALVEQGDSDPREAIDVARYLKLESIESYLTEKIHDELSQETGCLLK